MTVIKLQANFVKLLSIHGLSISALYRNTGIPITTLHRIRHDPNNNPTLSTLKPLANFFNITINQLIGDDPLPDEKSLTKAYSKRDNWKNVPIISWATATIWHEKSKTVKIDPIYPTISTDVSTSDNLFALEITDKGLSNIDQGTILIVDPTIKPKHYDYVITHKQGTESSVLKKYIIYEDSVYLLPLNNIFKTVQLDNTFQIVGTVIQIRLDYHAIRKYYE